MLRRYASRKLFGLLCTLTATLAVVAGISISEDAMAIVRQGRPRQKAIQVPKADLTKLAPREAGRLKGHGKEVWCATFGLDGRSVVTGGDDGDVVSWDSDRGVETGRYHQADFVRGLGLSRRGRKFVSASMTPYLPPFSGKLVLTDAAAGGQFEIAAEERWTFQCVDLHPNGRLLAAGGADRALRAWDLGRFQQKVAEKKVRREYFAYTPPAMPGEVFAVAFHPTRPIVAAAGQNGFVRLYEIGPRGLTASRVEVDGHGADIRCARFNLAGTSLATGGRDGLIRLWRFPEGTLARTIETSAGPVHGLAFSPDGALIASAQEQKVVKLWNAATGEPLAILEGHEAPVRCVDFSPDGRRMVSSGSDFVAILWDLYPDTPEAEPRRRR